MTLDEAICHAEEVAKEQNKLCKRYDDASGYTRSGNEKIRTNEAKKCAVCAEEHRVLAWWLRDYKRLKEQEPCEDCVSRQAVNNLVDELARAISDERCCLSRGRSTATIMQDILDLPSVKPQEPKTGYWIMRHRKVNTINYHTGEDVLTGEIHTVKELIRYETDEPYCVCCGKRAEDISQGYCGYCGARMEGIE